MLEDYLPPPHKHTHTHKQTNKGMTVCRLCRCAPVVVDLAEEEHSETGPTDDGDAPVPDDKAGQAGADQADRAEPGRAVFIMA